MSTNYSKYLDSKSTHYISNSGKDENSGTKGGKAGDQTGHEWELKKWYSRPWTVVLRYPDQKVALRIAELAIDAALNDKVGYDQTQRTSYWSQLKAAGYDASKIAVACEDDCTAGVSANVRAAGYIYGIKPLQNVPICTSRNMRKEFTKAGFIALTDSKYLTSGQYLLPGDILLYENHHAATNITIGSKVKGEWHPDGEAAQSNDEKPSAVPTGSYVIVSNGNYYVRETPNKNGAKIGIAPNGSSLPYLGENQNGWNKVQYNGKEGWISSKAGSINSKKVEYVTVGSGNWNIRQKPSVNGKRITTAKSGTKFVKLGEPVNGWQKIEYKGQEAYICARGLKK